jgi:hypothetical protein
MYNYHDAICEDIREYIKDEIDLTDYTSREELAEYLNDELWTDDGVTGNLSGSYTFSTWQAEENLCHNLDLLRDALAEFGGNALDVLKSPESADVTIRCYLLGECIESVLDEMEENNEIKFDEE